MRLVGRIKTNSFRINSIKPKSVEFTIVAFNNDNPNVDTDMLGQMTVWPLEILIKQYTEETETVDELLKELQARYNQATAALSEVVLQIADKNLYIKKLEALYQEERKHHNGDHIIAHGHPIQGMEGGEES